MRKYKYREIGFALWVWALEMFYLSLPLLGLGNAIISVTFIPLLILLPLIFNFIIEKKDRNGLGLNIFNHRRSLAIAIMVCPAIFLLDVVCFKLEGLQPIKASLSIFLILIFVSWLVFFVVSSFGEELSYRGFIQTRFQHISVFWGFILASILFGLVHVPKYILMELDFYPLISGFFSVTLMGLALGYMYWKTKSLFPPVVVHAFFDATAVTDMHIFGVSEIWVAQEMAFSSLVETILLCLFLVFLTKYYLLRV